MGTELDHLQVLMRGMEAEAAQHAAVQAVQDLLVSKGFTIRQQAGEGTHTYVVAARMGIEWVGIYTAVGSLEGLAAPLSEKLGQPVVHVWLSGTEAMGMRLYMGGSVVDTMSNWINYQAMPKERSGDPEKWAALLPAGSTVKGLQMVLQLEMPESRAHVQQTVDNAMESVLGALFKGDDALIERIKQRMPDKLVDIFSPTTADSQYRDLADLLEMDEELVHMIGRDFMDGESEEDDLLVSILYFENA